MGTVQTYLMLGLAMIVTQKRTNLSLKKCKFYREKFFILHSESGATTLSTMALGIIALDIMSLSITMLSKTIKNQSAWPD